jgi:hypothetical protein
MSNLKIIEQFHRKETQSMNHSDEYLDAILEVDYLEDLCDEVRMWIRGIKDKNEAAFYILTVLDS